MPNRIRPLPYQSMYSPERMLPVVVGEVCGKDIREQDPRRLQRLGIQSRGMRDLQRRHRGDP
jgi:hypothetical protein